VFLSEPYYRERRAFVDGERVSPVLANVAFMAVPVPAGIHRVELRLVPTTLYAGAVTSAATLGVWGVIAARFATRRRFPQGPRSSDQVFIRG
jgi:uncharacterized membrane protein YfhO